MATPLKAGVDCPATATFLPAVFGTDKGEPMTTPNAMCVFERSSGEPLWRHSEVINQTYEGRANVELVVRMATTIGNYDYLFDWVFNDAAEIEARVGATGIDALKGVTTRRMADATSAEDTRYGTLVAPNLVAVNHDHYFNFRLDLDVDEGGNSFNHDVYKPVMLPADSPRRSIYVVERQMADTEKAAARSRPWAVEATRPQREPHQSRRKPGVVRSARRQSRQAAAGSAGLAGQARQVPPA